MADKNQLTPHAPPPPTEVLAIHHTTRQFYHEVAERSACDRHCAWYHSVAHQHQRELQTLRRDFNWFGLFCRRRR